jgi:hypothetical protein
MLRDTEDVLTTVNLDLDKSLSHQQKQDIPTSQYTLTHVMSEYRE